MTIATGQDALASDIISALATKLNLSGGNMGGALLLAADPTDPLGAATRQYVDNHASNVPISGVVSIANIAALRAGTSATLGNGPVLVQGYYGPSDGGGGIYDIGTSTPDNGGTIVNDSSGRSWHLQTFGLPVSATQFGAKGDDSTDNTTTLQAWLNSGGDLYLPVGRFRSRALTSSVINQRIIGAGQFYTTAPGSPGSYLIMTGTNAPLLTFNPPRGDTILQDLTLNGLGSLGAGPAGASGVYWNGGTMRYVNVENFPAGGVAEHDSDNSQYNNLTCVNNGGANLSITNSNDASITNCQFGDTQNKSQYGLSLTNSSAATVLNCGFWGATIALYIHNSHYMQIGFNDITQSTHQGLMVDTSVKSVFIGNTINSNSAGSFGGFDNAYFTNCSECCVVGNKGYDWSGGKTAHRYGFYFDSCSNMTIEGNQDTGWNSGPLVIASDSPSALNYSDVTASLLFSSAVSVPSGSWQNVVSLSLDAGIWEISGVGAINPPNGVLFEFGAAIVGGALTGPGTGSQSIIYPNVNVVSGQAFSLSIGPVTVNIPGTTSFAVQVTATSSSGSAANGYGYIRAHRIC